MKWIIGIKKEGQPAQIIPAKSQRHAKLLLKTKYSDRSILVSRPINLSNQSKELPIIFQSKNPFGTQHPCRHNNPSGNCPICKLTKKGVS